MNSAHFYKMWTENVWTLKTFLALEKIVDFENFLKSGTLKKNKKLIDFEMFLKCRWKILKIGSWAEVLHFIVKSAMQQLSVWVNETSSHRDTKIGMASWWRQKFKRNKGAACCKDSRMKHWIHRKKGEISFVIKSACQR